MRPVAVLLSVVGLAVAAIVSAPPSLGAASAPSFRGLQLWKHLPTNEYATVLDQRNGGVRAGVYVYRREQQNARVSYVCIQQVVAYRVSNKRVAVSTGDGECSPLHSARGVSFALGSFDRNNRSVVGLVTARRSAHRMEVRFENGAVARRAIARLSKVQARKAGLPRLQVAAALLPNAGCVESITALDDAGGTVVGTGERACAPALARPGATSDHDWFSRGSPIDQAREPVLSLLDSAARGPGRPLWPPQR